MKHGLKGILNEMITKKEEHSAARLILLIHKEIDRQIKEGLLFRNKSHVDIWLYNAGKIELFERDEPRISLTPIVFVYLSLHFRTEHMNWVGFEYEYPAPGPQEDVLHIRLKGV